MLEFLRRAGVEVWRTNATKLFKGWKNAPLEEVLSWWKNAVFDGFREYLNENVSKRANKVDFNWCEKYIGKARRLLKYAILKVAAWRWRDKSAQKKAEDIFDKSCLKINGLSLREAVYDYCVAFYVGYPGRELDSGRAFECLRYAVADKNPIIRWVGRKRLTKEYMVHRRDSRTLIVRWEYFL